MASASVVQMNGTVTWKSAAIPSVTKIDVSYSGDTVRHSAGIDTLISHIAFVKRATKIVVHSDNNNAILGLTRGDTGALVATLIGADGGSNIVLTATGLLTDIEGGVSHADMAHGCSVTFEFAASDGTTDPVSKT